MSAQHTPGPWQRDGKGRTISSAKGPVCECFSGPVGIEECDANERLIAAAPDLLAVLNELFNSGHLIRFGCGSNEINAIKGRALAVIRKATGEQA